MSHIQQLINEFANGIKEISIVNWKMLTLNYAQEITWKD